MDERSLTHGQQIPLFFATGTLAVAAIFESR
jgi:hypothetical protein